MSLKWKPVGGSSAHPSLFWRIELLKRTAEMWCSRLKSIPVSPWPCYCPCASKIIEYSFYSFKVKPHCCVALHCSFYIRALNSTYIRFALRLLRANFPQLTAFISTTGSLRATTFWHRMERSWRTVITGPLTTLMPLQPRRGATPELLLKLHLSWTVLPL